MKNTIPGGWAWIVVRVRVWAMILEVRVRVWTTFFSCLFFFSEIFSKFYCCKNSELMVVYGAVKIATAIF